MAHPRFK
jgi:hypothetical protein